MASVALLLLLAFVAGMGMGGVSGSPGDDVSAACQMVLDLWCNTDASCVDVITRDGFTLPLVARFDLQKEGIWRCYSPSALDQNLSHYAGGKAFCSHKALADVLAVCDGSKPGPYPLPPAPEAPGGGGAGVGCASPFFAAAANATRPLDNARDKTEYRIPVVLSIPGTQVVVALAENRGGGSGDSGRHQLAMARSTDSGATFAPVINIYSDSAATVDGLNLGGAVWDNTQKRLSVLFNECFHLNAVGRGGCGAVGQTLQIDSDDHGLTWSAVINHTASLVGQGIKQLNPGPGTGVQLQYQKDTTKNGRLVMPGWGSKTTDPRGTSTRAIVLVSEASPNSAVGTAGFDEPLTWRAVLVPPQTPENVPNELQCAELPDGTLILNVRSGNHKLRLLSTSTDGGDSWSSLALSESMGEQAICQGSMISVGKALFYSHPFHTDGTRTDGWIKFSLDKGATWYPWAQVSPNSFGYSGLTLLSHNSSRLSLGVVWEGERGIEWKEVNGFMPGADDDNTITVHV